ncbi:MAG TPA: acyltransferase family protein [Albitalea sp.]|nr:acyltransferase family protein [Albitalea sp.]
MNTSPTRLYFLDWLRIGAFALLIVYHVGMVYVSWDFHIKSPSAGTAIEPFMLLSSPWRMSLLFLISGAATSMMLRSGASGALLRARTKRLLLPLVCGMLVIVPPQSYFEVVQKAAYAGSYLDFLQLYYSGYHGFCKGHDCLRLPTWNHLWFLPYLWVYTLLLWGLVRLRPRSLETLASQADRLLDGVRMLVVPIAVLALLRITLAGRFASTHALVDDWYNHSVYVLMFMAGAVLACRPALWERMPPLRWPALAVALGCWAMLIVYRSQASDPGDWLRQLMRVDHAALQWCAIVAALGFARRHLNRDHAWRRTLTGAVFPVYLLHQTLIIGLAMALAPLRLTAPLEGALLIAATFVLSFAGYLLVRKVRILRPWFGLAYSPMPNAVRKAPNALPFMRTE